MRGQLRELHRELGSAALHVTHDQAEAMSLGEKIAVLRRGALQQVGEPEGIYESPQNRFVAEFMGTPSMNFLPGCLAADGTRFVGAGFELLLPPDVRDRFDACRGRELVLGIRPEDVQWGSAPVSGGAVRGRVAEVEPLGHERLVQVRIGSGLVSCRAPGRSKVARGELVDLAFNVNRIHMFDNDSGQNLTRSARCGRPDG
jgi:multiple sugar transport system ATP-binding protein